MSANLGGRLVQAGTDLATALTDAGIPATLERAQVQTPGCWVTPQSVDITTLGGDAVGRFHLVLVVGDLGDAQSHRGLGQLLDKLLDADLDGGPLVPVEPVDASWSLVVRDTPLPAYRVAVDLDL